MRKLLLAILLAVLIPFPAKAEVPSGVFGFMDGKFYDSTSTLKYLCFMDGKCYDLNGVFSFERTPVASTPTDADKDFLENCYEPLDEFRLEMVELKADYNAEYAEILENNGGTWGSVVAEEVARLDAQYRPLEERIQRERNEFAAENCAQYSNRVLPNLY